MRFAPGSNRRRSHPSRPQDSGRMQQSLRLLRDSVRPRAQPQPAAGQVIAGVRKIVAAGAREIVLSGINLGSYGRDLAPRATLEVVRRILEETDVEQLRFSSIEPQDVTEDFVSLWLLRRIAPHFHVPLQSGSDRILRAMHRWYRAAHYAERMKLIRQAADAAIGADVIAGFPGETDEDFKRPRILSSACHSPTCMCFRFRRARARKERTSRSAEPPTGSFAGAPALKGSGQRKAADFRATQKELSLRALTLAGRAEITGPRP